MTDFEKCVRMDIYVWLGVKDLWSYGESAIQEYWKDYFDNCSMSESISGFEIVDVE